MLEGLSYWHIKLPIHITTNMSTQAQEMATTLRMNKGQLEIVEQQLSQLERQQKFAQATAKELESYPTETVWRSCGRAFVLQDKDSYIKDLGTDEKTLEEQAKALRIKKNYLDVSIEKTVAGLKSMMK